jgi:hypothetical protein
VFTLCLVIVVPDACKEHRCRKVLLRLPPPASPLLAACCLEWGWAWPAQLSSSVPSRTTPPTGELWLGGLAGEEC